MELYKKYRPSSLKRIVGQESAIRVLASFIKRDEVPHTLLFTGPSGCGKTTLARIMAKAVGCDAQDCVELNCADFRGIDMVRDIRSHANLAPISGDARVWILDEAHQITEAAQTAFLKLLEDTPRHVYFMLATTNPNKIKKTIHTRCTTIKVDLLNNSQLTSLVRSVCKKEGIQLDAEVMELLVETGEGSPRKALVLLDSIRDLKDADQQSDTIQKADVKTQAIEIARALIKPKTTWKTVSKILREVDEEPESLRYMILAYATTVLLSGGPLAPRAYLIIECFSDNFYDSKRAGLVASAYAVVSNKS